MIYNESHKIEIIDRINVILNAIEIRLLPTFDNIEEEARRIEEERLSELSESFNPETMDEGACYEDAFSTAGHHYMIQNEMKQEFLNHQATLLFHIYEKDCQKMCPLLHNNGTALKEKLEEIGIHTDENSHWYKINKELRLISNVIKHGEGRSYTELKNIREDLFKDKFTFLLTSDIEISLDDINYYGQEMKSFWEEFFSVVIPTNQ